jgi:hypothetical protein
MQLGFNHPVIGRVLGGLISRIVGVDPRVLVELYTPEDERRANRMSLQELADEVLALKLETA